MFFFFWARGAQVMKWLLTDDGGEKGGEVCFEGVPDKLISLKNNKTGKYLRKEFV